MRTRILGSLGTLLTGAGLAWAQPTSPGTPPAAKPATTAKKE